MRKLKRVISLILILVLVLCTVSVSAYAKEDEKYVAVVYVCQKARSMYLSGHTWLYFKNLTNHSIKVGLYSVPKNQGVSIGTFGYSIADGRGLYYNAEAWRYNAAKTTDFVCLQKKLTQEQLDRMSTKVTKSGYWTYLTNCSYSAFNIWDVTIEKFIPYLIFPLLARLCILIYPQHEDGFVMYKPKLSQVYKQIGWGKDAYLVHANPAVE